VWPRRTVPEVVLLSFVMLPLWHRAL
jgi:hypothetical protein